MMLPPATMGLLASSSVPITMGPVLASMPYMPSLAPSFGPPLPILTTQTAMVQPPSLVVTLAGNYPTGATLGHSTQVGVPMRPYHDTPAALYAEEHRPLETSTPASPEVRPVLVVSAHEL